MESLDKLRQLHSMPGNISSDLESSFFSEHAKQSGSLYKKRKRGRKKKADNHIPDDTSISMQLVTSKRDTIIDSDDLVARLEIISEISNSYDGHSCDTTTFSNQSNNSTNDDDSISDIPQFIDIPK